MIEYKAIIARDLVPLVRHLYKGGVLAVNGHDGSVHMTRELFHATFPEVTEPFEREDAVYPYLFSVTVDGVKFFCLSEKGELE